MKRKLRKAVGFLLLVSIVGGFYSWVSIEVGNWWILAVALAGAAGIVCLLSAAWYLMRN